MQYQKMNRKQKQNKLKWDVIRLWGLLKDTHRDWKIETAIDVIVYPFLMLYTAIKYTSHIIIRRRHKNESNPYKEESNP